MGPGLTWGKFHFAAETSQPLIVLRWNESVAAGFLPGKSEPNGGDIPPCDVTTQTRTKQKQTEGSE